MSVWSSDEACCCGRRIAFFQLTLSTGRMRVLYIYLQVSRVVLSMVQGSSYEHMSEEVASEQKVSGFIISALLLKKRKREEREAIQVCNVSESVVLSSMV